MITSQKEQHHKHKFNDKNLFLKTKSQESDDENSPKPVQTQTIDQTNLDSPTMDKSTRKYKRELRSKAGGNWNIFYMSLIIFILLLSLIGLAIFTMRITKQQIGFSSLFSSFDREQILGIFVGLNGNQNTRSLLSFLQNNNYPITTFVGIVKFIPDEKLIKKQKYDDFIWVIQGEDKYLYATLDKILNQYKMKYFFYFDDQWQFVKDNFITDSLNLLKRFSSTQQVLLYNPQNKPASSNSKNLGFSFSPGLHRRSDFISVETQFSRISDEAQRTNTTVESILSIKFMRKYMYALTTKQNYVSRINQNRGTNQNIYGKIRYDSSQRLNKYNEQQREAFNKKEKKNTKQLSGLENGKQISSQQKFSQKLNINPGQIKTTAFKQTLIQESKNKDHQISQQVKEKKIIAPLKRSRISNFGDESEKYIESLKKYSIKIDKFPDQKIGQVPLSYYGIDKNIQVGSSLDYLNISQSSQFKLMKVQWQNTLTYSIMNFKSEIKIENKKYLKMNGEVKSYESIQLYVRKSLNQKLGLTQQYNIELGLAILLTLDPGNLELQQAQYLYLNHKYSIGNYTAETPICLFCSGYNIASDNKYQEFFESIQMQNYTNYKLIFVDDGSKDNSADIIYNYLQKKNLSLKSRIQIVKNDFTLGSVGNLYLRIKQFCKQNDIVVSVNIKDKLIGHQVLKIINSVYQNPQVWYAYSRFISHVPNRKAWSFSSASSPVKINPSTYRTAVNQWSTSHLKTFRYSLFYKVPIQTFVEYHYNEARGQLEPRFYGGDAADRFIVYSMLELCGRDRIFHIEDGLYYQYPQMKKKNKCQNEHSYVDELKCRTKTPFQMLKSIEDRPIALENYIIPEIILSTLARYFQNWQRCIEIMESQNQDNL